MERRIAPSARIEDAIEEVLLGGLDDADRLTELGRLGAQLVLQRAVEEEVAAFLGRARYVKRPGFRGDSDRRVQAAEATCCVAQYAASYSAGGMSPQAPWRRRVFHQWTQRAVAASTSSTERQGPRRLMSSAL